MRPALTIVIPCYNAVPFLDHSIHSLISERVIDENLHNAFEIIIINDGSTDKTIKKANELAAAYNKITHEGFITIIDKKNGQYGSVINRGIKEAKGRYIKILDCDDTLNTTTFINVLYIIMSIEKMVDVIFTDHTFEKVGTNEQILNSLRKYFEPYKILNFKKQELPSAIMTMHSYIYRTDFLKDMNYQQIEGVYYSDSQYALLPLVQAKTMYYINQPLYRYYIGRDEQSINLKVMVKNRLHQEAVVHAIFDNINLKTIKSKFLKEYAIKVLRQMLHWNLLIIVYDKSIKNKSKEIFNLIKLTREKQPEYSKKILAGILFLLIKMTRGKFLVPITKIGVKIYAKFRKNIMAEWD